MTWKPRAWMGVALAACVAWGEPIRAGAGPPAGFVVIDESAGPEAWREIAAHLERHGARLPLRLPPDVLVGNLPAGIEGTLAELGPLGRSVRIERQGGAPLQGPLGPHARAARRSLSPLLPVPGIGEPPALAHDIVEPLPGDLAPRPKGLPDGCGRPAATSAVLVGSVSIGILLPESVGPDENSEDWSNEDPAHPGEDRQDLVVAEIIQGCAELVAGHPEAGLSFTLDVRRSVGIPFEPIEHAVGDRAGWIAATLEAIGFGAASGSFGTWSYLQALRDAHDTDWAAAAYVVDDWNDADNGFPPTGFPFAYALLGGPYMVMTYDNGGWGIERMNVVFRHELGHVFQALDEYRSAGNSCGATAGWLGVKNGNNDSAPGDPACESSVACYMRGNDTTSACAFTAGQVGIRDIDGDGIPDVRNAPPNSGFEDASPLFVASADVVLRARASARPLPEESPQAPVGFTLNRIAGAEMRLDGGAWSPLVPLDGAPGDRCEDFELVLAGLSEGWHDVEIRAINDLGLVEPSPALLRLHVNTDCIDDAFEPDDSPEQAVARRAGVHALRRCAYDSDWSRFFLQAGAAVTISIVQDDASAPLTLRLLDPAGAEMGRAGSIAGIASVASVAAVSGVHFAVVEEDSDFETDYVLSIDAACVDDVDEPDSPAPLGRESHPGILRDRMLCAGDEDRYLVALQEGESLQADLAFDPLLADLDLELLDPAGVVIASSLGTDAPESAALAGSAEGVHVVRVFGKTPADRSPYDLTLAATGCVDDAAENDDDAASARPIDPGRTVRGVLCAGDEDWLSIEVEERRLVRLLLTHDPMAGNLDLELHDASGRVVARSHRAGGSEEIRSERLPAGQHHVRIVGTWGSRVAWSFTFEQVDPLLLFVRKDPSDALLSWNRSEQECFTVRRSTVPSDFSGAVTTLVQDGDPSVLEVDRPIEDVGMRDAGVILDGTTLYCYLVDPHDCDRPFVGSLKSARPHSVLVATPGGIPSIEYEVIVRNGSLDDAYGVIVTDELPGACDAFTILEMPPGSTDASLPAPAGANGRGRIVITGIDVPAGQERVVRFAMTVAPRTTFENPVIDNQAVIEHVDGAGLTQRVLSDDGLTQVFGDATRVMHAGSSQQLLVHAFWHRDVDLDLVVRDPCGNLVSQQHGVSATCMSQEGRVLVGHSCAAPSPQSRYERIGWSGFPPPPGEYVVSVSYPGSWPDDAACTGSGSEDVTVVVQRFGAPVQWQTISLEAGTTVEVLRFVP